MAFGFEYLMVYLPEFNPDSFLLFVHNPAGSTKLRDYSSGRERVVGQPSLSEVCRATDQGLTRFRVDEHKVIGEDGARYWISRTLEFNLLHLGSIGASVSVSTVKESVVERSGIRKDASGLAFRGSQRQLQDYINLHETALSEALVAMLPPRLLELRASIRWVSPLAEDDYVEYRDIDFLRSVGLGEHANELLGFWPSGGPSWDGLAIVSTPEGKTIPGVLLVEAKSHIPEVYGNGCQASLQSRAVIEKSIAGAKQWCGARMDADWFGPLYQSANRLAHLYFLRDRLRRPAWLVNLYFLDDPFRPTGQDAWDLEIRRIKESLGLTRDVPGVIELFLPALMIEESDTNDQTRPQVIEVPTKADLSTEMVNNSFAIWRDRWTALAEYAGPTVPDHLNRIEQIVALWKEPIPGEWQRGIDPQLLGPRYRRGNLDNDRRGEHAIEYDILCKDFGSISCFGYQLIDGINAFPLSRDTAGHGRRANVEADMLLLAERDGTHRLFLCEVKDKSNDPWFATVECLRQLRLFLASRESIEIFLHRRIAQCLSSGIPVTALVLAPSEFFSSPGKKVNALKPTSNLIARCASDFGLDLRLAIWDPKQHQIRAFDHR